MRRLCHLGAIALIAGTLGALTLPVSSVQAGTATPSIAGGGIYTCAVSAAGTVDCWGTNSEGQLGNGAFVTTAGPSTPVAVCAVGQASCTSSTDELTGVTAVTAGGSADGGGGQHACALRVDTTVVCWGDNTIGELGVGDATGPQSCGTSSPCSTIPVAVVTAPGVPLTGVTAIAAGHGHTCAVLTDTTVDCWGDNSQGQLGIANGPTQICASLFVCSPTPQQVVTSLGVPLAGVTAITAGHFYSCAVLSDGSVDCWGDNGFGELGNGPTTGPKTCASPGLGSIACSPSRYRS